jgi:hypothetical protein
MDASGFYVDSVTLFVRSGAAGKGDPTFGAGVTFACRVELDRSKFPEGIGSGSAKAALIHVDAPTLLAEGITPETITTDDVCALQTVNGRTIGETATNGRQVALVQSQSTKDGSYTTYEIYVD